MKKKIIRFKRICPKCKRSWVEVGYEDKSIIICCPWCHSAFVEDLKPK